ncbi:hypothetical protein ACFVUS_34805 [Nocardia sp. NPDC058058]|uniref:hypothetical protein n=1 Tax=Nocardia sp. NPDC058058 TaxID=3346317 RepID=UPI0036DF43FC
MRQYDSHEVAKLDFGISFVDDQSERECPVCESVGVRTYVYRHNGGNRTVLFTYSWCKLCRRFKGWTGADTGEYTFSDPIECLPESEREIYRRSLAKLLPKLDKLWDAGELPQQFVRVKPAKKRARK